MFLVFLCVHSKQNRIKSNHFNLQQFPSKKIKFPSISSKKPRLISNLHILSVESLVERRSAKLHLFHQKHLPARKKNSLWLFNLCRFWWFFVVFCHRQSSKLLFFYQPSCSFCAANMIREGRERYKRDPLTLRKLHKRLAIAPALAAN